jgi:hypothetical protein
MWLDLCGALPSPSPESSTPQGGTEVPREERGLGSGAVWSACLNRYFCSLNVQKSRLCCTIECSLYSP